MACTSTDPPHPPVFRFLGGARRGMLLNNLSVSDGCKVSFDSESATAPPSPEAASEAAPAAGRVFKRPGEAGGGDGDEKEVGPCFLFENFMWGFVCPPAAVCGYNVCVCMYVHPHRKHDALGIVFVDWCCGVPCHVETDVLTRMMCVVPVCKLWLSAVNCGYQHVNCGYRTGAKKVLNLSRCQRLLQPNATDAPL